MEYVIVISLAILSLGLIAIKEETRARKEKKQ